MCQRYISFLALLFVLLSTRAAEPPLVIAHRGGAGLAPENTLACIEKAIALGVDVVEVDVRLTADSVIVVCHDETIDRTTNGCGCVSRLSLQEIQACSIVDSNGIVTSEKIPTLAQVLTLVDGRCRLLVEVKHEGFEEQLIKEIVENGAVSLVSVQSFCDNVLERLHELNAPFPLEKLIVLKLPFLPFVVDNGLSRFSLKKYDYISSFNFSNRFLARSLATKIRAAGKRVAVWGDCDRPSDVRCAVDAVITDYPNLFIGNK